MSGSRKIVLWDGYVFHWKLHFLNMYVLFNVQRNTHPHICIYIYIYIYIYIFQYIYTYIHTHVWISALFYVCQRNTSVSAKRMIQEESQYFGGDISVLASNNVIRTCIKFRMVTAFNMLESTRTKALWLVRKKEKLLNFNFIFNFKVIFKW